MGRRHSSQNLQSGSERTSDRNVDGYELQNYSYQCIGDHIARRDRPIENTLLTNGFLLRTIRHRIHRYLNPSHLPLPVYSYKNGRSHILIGCETAGAKELPKSELHVSHGKAV